MTIIPQINQVNNPEGRYWDQPKTEDILVDDTHAIMTRKTFNRLMDYSRSQPSGVYSGKMWKAQKFKVVAPLGYNTVVADGWNLCWFGIHSDPKLCSNNYREILLID